MGFIMCTVHLDNLFSEDLGFLCHLSLCQCSIHVSLVLRPFVLRHCTVTPLGILHHFLIGFFRFRFNTLWLVTFHYADNKFLMGIPSLTYVPLIFALSGTQPGCKTRPRCAHIFITLLSFI